MTAAARALHLQQPPPHVLSDRLSIELAGEQGMRLAEALRRELPAQHLASFASWVAVRARFTEDMLERAVGEGVGQYVVLGAGLDTFAFRSPDWARRLRIYEVDHPLSQQWKRGRLDELGVAVPHAVAFVPVDFERDNLGEALAAAGLDDSAPAFFSWIGVTNYISVDAIRQVLGTVASIGPATRIVLSYDVPREAVAKPGLYDFLRSRSAEYDEPFISFFTPRGIETLMRDCGFGQMVHFGPAEAIRDYFAARPDLELSGAQRLLHATALAPGERPG